MGRHSTRFARSILASAGTSCGLFLLLLAPYAPRPAGAAPLLKSAYITGLANDTGDISAIEVGDLNSDGHPDVVVTTLDIFDHRDSLIVLLGTGDGTLGAPIAAYAVRRSPVDIAIGDLNGDGKPDVVVANRDSNNVSVFRGLGNGTLVPNGTVATAAAPVNVALGDLNGDGRADAVIAGSTSNAVTILLATASGGLASRTDLPLGARCQGVSLGDLDGDGRRDLVTLSYGFNAIERRLGNGDGTFGPPLGYTTPPGTPRSLAVVDIDRDGKLDVAVYQKGAFQQHIDNSLTIRYGLGDGTFGNANVSGFGGIGGQDADYDMIALAAPPGARRYLARLGGRVIYTSSGGGGPTSPSPGGSCLAEADLEGDGVPEFLVGFGHDVAIFHSGGGTSFGNEVALSTADPMSVAVGDVNRDGHLDLVVGQASVSRIGVRLGLGAGAFGAQSYYGPGAPGGPVPIALGDLNGDGWPDVATGYAGQLTVLINDTFGGFAELAPLQLPAQVRFIATADVDGDGDLDVIAAGGDQIAFGRVSVIPNNGDATFGPRIDYPTAPRVEHVAVADFNRDGRVDFAAPMALDALNNVGLSVYIANTSGGFARTDYSNDAGFGMPVAAGDVNGDGKPDLLDASSTGLLAMRGVGDGTFTLSVVSQTLLGTLPQLADVDADGRLDLISFLSSMLEVRLGVGNGAFKRGSHYGVLSAYPTTSEDITGFAIADVDENGSPDVVASGDQYQGTAFVLSSRLVMHRILASAGSGGHIDPAGDVGVGEGTSRTFAIVADHAYHIDNVQVDGVSVGPVSTYTFAAIVSDHTIAAAFLPGAVSVDPTPKALAFAPVRPTPSRGEVRLVFELPRAEAVTLEIYDAAGRKQSTVVQGLFPAGVHEAVWRGDLDGRQAAEAGLYFARLAVGARHLSRRVVWLR